MQTKDRDLEFYHPGLMQKIVTAGQLLLSLFALMLLPSCQSHPAPPSTRPPSTLSSLEPLTRTPAVPEILFTFEELDDLNSWSVNLPARTRLELSQEWAARGANSLKVTYHPVYDWPVAMLARPAKEVTKTEPKLKRFFELLDSGLFDHIVLKMYNPQEREVTLLVNTIPFRLPAKSTTPVEFSIQQLVDGVGGSVGNLKNVGIWGYPEQGKFSVFIDEVGLVKTPENGAWQLQNARELAKEAVRANGGDLLALGVESAMRQVYPEPARYTPTYATKVELKAARNESECFQAVAFPVAGALADITWTLPSLVNAKGQSLPASVRVVGYVACDPVHYVLNADGGWYPDLLVDADRVAALPAGTYLSLWVKIHAPADAEPGRYQGSLTVQAVGAKPQSIAITMDVWPFTLPTRPALRQAYALCETVNSHGFPTLYPAERQAEMRTKFEDMLVGEYRMDANNIYRTTPPKLWNALRLRELVAMGLTGICLGQFPLNPLHYPGTNPDLNARMAEIEEYLKVVDEAGVRKLCYFYGFDEAGHEGLEKLFTTAAELKNRFPDIPFLTTANAYQQIKGALLPEAKSVDWWCPISSAYFWGEPAGRGNIQKARELGHGLWWYICNCSPAPEPNFDIEQSPVEPRILLGALSAKYEVLGFLYYALSYWGNNALPADTSRLPFVEWNPNGISVPDRYNGQGILVAAGPDGPIPTIRMEMIRDGLEDYDYYAILRAAGPEGMEAAQVPETVALNGFHHTVDAAVMEAERARLAEAMIKLGLPGSEGEKPVAQRIAPRATATAVAAPPSVVEEIPSSLPVALDATKTYTMRLTEVGYMRIINLGEIQVFCGDENLALKGQVRMSSQSEMYPAVNLIDGNTSGSTKEPGGLAHGNWEIAPWAEIDLPTTDSIDRIVIWNRILDGEDSNARLLPFELSLRDAEGLIVWKTLIRRAPLQTTKQMKAGDNRFQQIVIAPPEPLK